MPTRATPETFNTELRMVSPAEIRRIHKEAHRLKAETQADLLRAAGRGLLRLGRSLAELFRPTRQVPADATLRS